MTAKKRTKIICTIGPASAAPETVEKMVSAGMNVARLNFSHGTHEDHAKLIATLRAVSKKTGEPIALLQDLQGPKIRVGTLPKEGVMLTKGADVVLSTDSAATLPKIPVGYQYLHEDVKGGDTLLLDDGLLELKVKEVSGRDIVCEVVTGGPLTSHKGINVPTATLKAAAITDKDKADVKFGVEQGVDFVALSFVRSAAEIHELRAIIKTHEGELGKKYQEQPPIRIIAKIEKHEALKNLDDIISAVDVIMVARGDLGIETPAAEVPLAQKRIIEKCLAAGKPVIVATQMLDSMIRNPRPTRAEVSDVANAVIDHTDAVMLSGESATGKYPVEAVEIMGRIVAETEASGYDDIKPRHDSGHKPAPSEAVSEVAGILAQDVGAKLILAASMTGMTGRLVSSHRPELPIYVATPSERVSRQLNLSWGVSPFVLPPCKTVEQLVEKSIEHLKKDKRVKAGDTIIVVSGAGVGAGGGASRVEVRVI